MVATRDWYQGTRQPWESLLVPGVLETRTILDYPDPADDPITLALARDLHLRVTNGDAEDLYITHLLAVSREMAEAATQRAVLPQRWVVLYSRFPDADIVLPFPPLIAVESVVFLDEDGDAITWGDDEYIVRRPTGPKAQRAHIARKPGGSWPAGAGAVQVTFRCGYLDESVTPAVVNVPADLTHARLLLVGEFYKQRSDAVVGLSSTPAAISAQHIFDRYRVQ